MVGLKLKKKRDRDREEIMTDVIRVRYVGRHAM